MNQKIQTKPFEKQEKAIVEAFKKHDCIEVEVCDYWVGKHTIQFYIRLDPKVESFFFFGRWTNEAIEKALNAKFDVLGSGTKNIIRMVYYKNNQ